MAQIIPFPPRKFDIEGACREAARQMNLAARFGAHTVERAIKKVDSASGQWLKTDNIAVDIAPDIAFTPQQVDEITRLCSVVAKEAQSKLFVRVLTERLVSELSARK